MSTINNVGQNSGIPFMTNFAPDVSTAALTPEALLMYCSSRLEALDTNIKQYFAEQQRCNAAIRDASKAMEILQRGTWVNGQLGANAENGKEGSWGTDPATRAWHAQNHADKANELLALWRSTDSPEVKAACEAAFRQVSGRDLRDFSAEGRTISGDEVLAAAGNIKGVTKEERAAQIEALKNEQSNLSKASEMNMIQLQSLVSQRQLAVQLTTQMMQTLHESSKQVLGNIR